MVKNVLCFLLLLISTTALRAEPYVVQNRDLDPGFWRSNVNGEKPFLSRVKHLVGAKDIEKTIPSTWKSVDASRLKLAETYSVRCYFVGEDTNTCNALYLGSVDPLVIFPNASTAVKYANADKKNLDESLRTECEPLFPGDFVDLGRIKAGRDLDFCLLSNVEVNSPSCSSMTAFCEANNPYILLCCNYCHGCSSGNGMSGNILFAIKVGESNVNSILKDSESIPSPEPLVFIPVACAGIALIHFRRKR